jgi:predicted P-loop ATPase
VLFAINARMSGLCWANILDCTSQDHQPRSTLGNAVLVLQHEPTTAADRLYYDEFLDRVQLCDDTNTVREWRDDDDTRLTVFMQQTVGMLTVQEKIVSSAVRYVARQRTRHCVRDYLDALRWDGIERIAHAFEDFWGAEPSADQPCDYLRAVSANFFIALVARVRRPGCKSDHMPVFEGRQGLGKERALTALGGPWYMVSQYAVGNIDFLRSLPGKWIVEIGELDSFSRAEKERVKIVISSAMDRYRTPNARHAHDAKRQCIFAGTTNKDDWGNDDTGLRRFWPVTCGDINVDGLLAARDQLFAEADRAFAAGQRWWETPYSTLRVQADRQIEDVWTATVLEHIQHHTETSLAAILRDGLKIRDAEMTRSHQLRVGSILTLAGWKKRTTRREGRLCKRWFPPEDEEQEEQG